MKVDFCRATRTRDNEIHYRWFIPKGKAWVQFE